MSQLWIEELPQQKWVDFCRRHPIRKLSLFGSALRPDFSPASVKLHNCRTQAALPGNSRCPFVGKDGEIFEALGWRRG